MIETFQKLDWDSNFFSFDVVRILGIIENEQDIRNVETLFKKNNIKLAYYSASKELPSFAFENEKFEIALVDKKTTYVKHVNTNLSFHKSITAIDSRTPLRDKLIKLAIQSGRYSRFNIDKKVGKDKYEKMYTLWMINSLNHTISKEVLISVENNELMGFVTLGEKNNRADVGIIAVDCLFRGNGFGKILMKGAEKWFSDNGYKSIQVVTQGDNILACKLYEKCGYEVEKIENFYHIWRK